MPRKLELTGRTFGKLFVASEKGKGKHGAYLWECLCECGNVSVIATSKGYTKDNIRIVSYKANTIKNNATLEELEMVVEYVKAELSCHQM